MKRTMLFFAWCLAMHAEGPPAGAWTGTLVNTTANVSASATLVLAERDGQIAASLLTAEPLKGTGALKGVDRDGWCVLSGALDGGFELTLRGVRSATGFVGTYVAKPAQGEIQFGRFEFRAESRVTRTPGK